MLPAGVDGLFLVVLIPVLLQVGHVISVQAAPGAQISRDGTDDDLEVMVNQVQDRLHHVEQGVLQLLGRIVLAFVLLTLYSTRYRLKTLMYNHFSDNW